MKRLSNEKLILLEWLSTPEHERKFKYTQSQNDRYAMYWAEQEIKSRRKARKIQVSGKVKRFFTRWHRKFCRPRPVNWRHEYGSVFPFCPACDEFAYDQRRCVFCGQPFTESKKSGGTT